MSESATVVYLPPLHPSQQEVAESRARYKVVCCGRRWGKTVLGVTLCYATALRGGRTWWVAPTYAMAREGWDLARQLARQLPPGMVQVREADRALHYATGGRIEVRTADNPDYLRGAGLDGLVLDEAAVVKRETWTEVLRPTLADRRGWALFISTPRGRNWFWELFRAAQGWDDWQTWQLPSHDNPFLDPAELDAMRAEMSATEYEQEVLASFVVNSSAIYAVFDPRRHLMPLRPTAWHGGAVGADYGDVHLSTAVAVTVDDQGCYWVRDVWAGDGDTGRWLAAISEQCAAYGISRTRIRIDPTQRSVARAYGFQPAAGGPGARLARIGLVKYLLESGRLYIDLAARGAVELAAELQAYRWEQAADGSLREVPHRVGEDRVAALEYAIEELEHARTLSVDAYRLAPPLAGAVAVKGGV